MTSIFLSSTQAAQQLGFPLKTTIRILQERGLMPVDLGVGAGRGLRWNAVAVRAIADTLQAEAQAKSTIPKRKKRPMTTCAVIGRNVSDLFKELNGAVQ